MRVLVTGGSGVIGNGLLPELLRRGHQVRLLARGAEDAAEEWPRAVEPFAGDVTHPESLRGAAEGCAAIVHVTGIVDEQPPDVTFDAVNVTGTANVLAEAARAGAPRFIFISSLGADRGDSDYHRSKRTAERIVADYKGPWTILRPGNVYGPGDDVLSKMVEIARALPVIPLVGDGDQPFQPLWFEDFGRAVADAVERGDLAGRTLELAGTDTTTMRDLVGKLNTVLNRNVKVVPTPEFAAGIAASATSSLGIDFPLTDSKLTMLLEGNTIGKGSQNALVSVFGIDPLPLGEGLDRLARLLPEEGPSKGIGALERKRFWSDIQGTATTPEALIAIFRRDYRDVFPIEVGVEGDANGDLEEGESVTMKLPLRGHVQVRVEQVTPREVTFVTIEGHPLAGAVAFRAEPAPRGVRFLVEVHARAASWLDYVTLKAGGSFAQSMNWETVVSRIVERSGGTAPDGVQSEKEKLQGDGAERAEGWIERMITRRRRRDHTEDANRDRDRVR
jgi:NADH dehydrogenase